MPENGKPVPCAYRRTAPQLRGDGLEARRIQRFCVATQHRQYTTGPNERQAELKGHVWHSQGAAHRRVKPVA